jgi:hypothetical protein
MDTEDTKTSRLSKRTRLAFAATALVAIGGTAGAIAVSATRPPVEMAPLSPVSIRSLVDSDSIVTLKGRVAEIYGNKFVIVDASGRALVDVGREGEGKDLVTVGQPLTVQGRFEHGFVHASFLIGAGSKVISLRPAGPPHGPGRLHERHGQSGDNGQRGDAPPPHHATAQGPTAPSTTASPDSAVPIAPSK